MNRLLTLLVVVGLSLASTSVWAKQFRVGQIPNASQFSCDTCHEPGNTGYVNQFGVQVLSHLKSGDVKWEEMWNLDADGDGYTNGQELGDPNGTWRIGMANPTFRATHPGYADQNLCNNGTLEEVEQCDRVDLRGRTCQDEGFATGGLGCDSLCQYDVSGCSNCGNGVIEKGDQCDGAELGGVSCESLGYDSGAVSCLTNCRIDLSQCVGEPTPNCGDGIRVRTEECEGEDLGQRTCTALGWSGGTLRCNEQCTYDTSLCSGTGPEKERLTEVPTDVEGSEPDALDDGADSTCSSAPSGDRPLHGWVLVLVGLFMLRRKRSRD